MRGMRTVVAVAMGIVVGCGSARYIAPPPLAQAQARNLTRWDYFCFSEHNLGEAERRARGAGAEGWELTATGQEDHGAFWCFKRSLP